jgi:hypothetical protein
MYGLEDIMLTDEKLLEVSTKVDNFLMEIANENEMPALALSAVILARLMLINNEMQSTDDFKKLMGVVSEAPILKNTTQPLH